jgi:hypothetical protein
MDTTAKDDMDRSWAEMEKSREKLDEEKVKQHRMVAAMIGQTQVEKRI